MATTPLCPCGMPSVQNGFAPDDWRPRPDAGKLLRLARVAADLRTKDVARAAGISSTHLANLEACRHRLMPEVAARLIRAILAEAP